MHSTMKGKGDQAATAVEAFLDSLRPGGPWVLSAIVPDGVITTITAESPREARAFVREHTDARNLYFSVNPTRTAVARKAAKIDIVAIEYIFGDLDPRQDETPADAKARYLEAVDQLGERPTACIDSGNGLQCLWRLDEPIELPDAEPDKAGKPTSLAWSRTVADIESRTAALMRKLGSKAGTQNVDRILRLPGTVNLPNGAKRKAGRVACATELLWFDDTEHPLSAFPAEAQGQGGNRERVRRDKRGDEHDAGAADLQGGRDESGSGYGFRYLRDCRSAGMPYDDAIERLKADAGRAGEWARRVDERQLQRAWEHQAQEQEELPAGDLAALLAEFNSKYMVVNDNGTILVFAERYDAALERKVHDRMRPGGLNVLYANRRVCTHVDDDGKRVYVPVAKWWLTHPDRRQYVQGVLFDPSGRPVPDGTLNLWTGFAVTPAPGRWRRMREHIRDVVCCGDAQHFDYLMGWMARLFQFPAKRGEVAVVLRGEIGTGKGTLGHALRVILGQHGLYVSSSKHLIGTFNRHLRDCVFLFADEAFFAGDKAGLGTLKALITEPTLIIEAKGIDAIQASNMLHVLMASNSDWVVPAAIGERRFFVLDVSNEHAQDHEYFGGIMRELEAGGYAAMLHELLAYDLTGFNVRDVPDTAALQDQKEHSLDTVHAWWLDCLARGYVFKSKLGLEELFAEWHEIVATELLFESYLAFVKSRGERHPLSRESLGRFMRKRVGAKATRPRGESMTGEHIIHNESGNKYAAPIRRERAPGYNLGTLEASREDFAERLGVTFEWR